jgi:capsule polysaccharide export protein KpsC/LpsZ
MSEAVICINSGVGFEALIHGKSVITAGHSDYHWAAHQISTVDDLTKTGNWQVPLLSNADVKKFLCFFLCDYLVDIRDPKSIYKCIDRAVSEYKAGLSTGEI